MNKILITGGTGFIGYHLAYHLNSFGWEVTSVSLNNPIKTRFINGVEYLKVDITNKKEVQNKLKREFDYVVNLGGYINHNLISKGGDSIINSHFNGLKNLVNIIPRDNLKRFIQIGSSDEYGSASSPQSELERESPISPYSFGKVASSHFLQMMNRTENYPATILRLFLTYGPGQDLRRFLPQIILGCINKKTFPTSKGEQLRDFCYVADTVNAIERTLTNNASNGQIFNIASGNPIKIKAMIDMIVSKVGSGKPKYGDIPYRIGENMKLYANIEKAMKILDWAPKINISEGLDITIKWYMKDNNARYL